MKCISSFVLALAPVLSAQSYTFSSLSVPFAGATNTRAQGINDLGTIVGSYQDGSLKTHGFVLKNGTYKEYDVPGSTSTAILGINSRG